MTSRDGTPWADRVVVACTASAAIAAPLALGGVTPAGKGLVALLLLLGAAARLCRRDARRAWAPFLALVVLGLAVLTPVRLVPGICDALHLDSPSCARLPAGLHPDLTGSPATLHLAPGAAWSELLLLVIVALALALVDDLCRRRVVAASRVVDWVLAGGAAVLAVAVADRLIGSDKLVGLYSPEFVAPRQLVRSTLLGVNSLSSYLLLVAFLAVARSTRTRSQTWTALFAGLALSAAVAVVGTLSRGGLIVLLLSVPLCWLVLAKEASRKRGGQDKAKVGIKALGLGIVVLLGAFGVLLDPIVQEFRLAPGAELLGDNSKVKQILSALRVVASHPWLGVGPGAFPDAVNAFQTGDDSVLLQVENLPLQVLVDHGVLLGGGAMLAALLALLPISRSALGGSAFTRLCGLGVLAVIIHDLADFALFIPGVAVPAAATFGTLSARISPPRFVRVPLSLFLLGAGALTVIALPLLSGSSRSATTHRIEVAAKGVGPLGASVIADLQRYPRYGIPFALLADRVGQESGAGAAMSWLDAAVAMSPARFAPRISRARLLQRNGEVKAAGRDYVAACRSSFDYDTRHTWVHAIVAGDKAGEVFAHMALTDPECAETMLRVLWGTQRGAVRAFAASAVRANPGDPRMRYLLARALFERGDDSGASVLADELVERFPDRSEGWDIKARVIEDLDPKAAVRLYQKALEKGSTEFWLRYYLARAAADAGDAILARQTLARAREVPGGEAVLGKSFTHLIEARLAFTRGHPREARQRLSKAGSGAYSTPSNRLFFLRVVHRLGDRDAVKTLCGEGELWKTEAQRSVAWPICGFGDWRRGPAK
jgi:hypothetical protein